MNLETYTASCPAVLCGSYPVCPRGGLRPGDVPAAPSLRAPTPAPPAAPPNRGGYDLEEGVAVFTVKGRLLGDAPLFSALAMDGEDNTDVDRLEADLLDVLLDPRVQGIALLIDSLGGHFSPAFARALFRQRAVKPSVAYVHRFACSAAYRLAAACSYIVADEGARVGSIGALQVCCFGGRRETLYAGPNKARATLHFPPILPLAASLGQKDGWEARERLQAEVNRSAADFLRDVLTFRPQTAPHRDTLALSDVYDVTRAHELGLIDATGTPEDAAATLLDLIHDSPWSGRPSDGRVKGEHSPSLKAPAAASYRKGAHTDDPSRPKGDALADVTGPTGPGATGP